MKIFKQQAYQIDANTWVCPEHLPPLRMPIQCERCWMCNQESPLVKKREIKVVRISRKKKEKPLPTLPQDLPKCEWKDCDKPQRENSKYCSRTCSNANARWRHRERQKEKE